MYEVCSNTFQPQCVLVPFVFSHILTLFGQFRCTIHATQAINNEHL